MSRDDALFSGRAAVSSDDALFSAEES